MYEGLGLRRLRVIESVFEKLVDWAAAALEKSSNQPVLPHAIIVLNASDNSTNAELWDIDVRNSKASLQLNSRSANSISGCNGEDA